MKKRLKYERINGSNDVISIDLYNGYSVIAVSGRKSGTDKYTTTLFIKDNEIDTWRMVKENIELSATYQTINSAILKEVSVLLENGMMDKYIDIYNFEEECAYHGSEIIERERLGKG